MSTAPDRPAVSVIVPFLGDAEEADRLLAALARLELAAEDGVIVADNGPTPIVPDYGPGQAWLNPRVARDRRGRRSRPIDQDQARAR